MGQDGEDRENGDPGLTVSRGDGDPRSFRREIRIALRYERGLFIKALVALTVVALVAVARTLYVR